jgi:hypothetical protein
MTGLASTDLSIWSKNYKYNELWHKTKTRGLSSALNKERWKNPGANSGFGSLVAGGWFIADYGILGINYLLGNGAVSLGDMIDNSSFGKKYTYEMYDGLY